MNTHESPVLRYRCRCRLLEYIMTAKYIRSATWKFIMASRNSCSGEIIWKTKIGAYLYTEVKAENDISYFGADGKGGKFWAVNLLASSTVYKSVCSLQNLGAHGRIVYRVTFMVLLLIESQPKKKLINQSPTP